MSKERVAIVKVVEQRLDDAVSHTLNLLGGLEALIPRGSRVMVKPNIVIAPTNRGITHPELIEAVVRLVAQAAPREIVIAEGSGDTYTTQGFRFQGLGRIAARYGARLLDLNLEEGVRTAVPADLGREYIMMPKAVVESDVFVSLPVFKLWSNRPMSLSVKNLIGLYGGRYYGYNKDSDVRGRELPYYGLLGEVGVEQGAHKPTVAASVCALNMAVHTDLAIIDALEGGDGKGNWLRLDTLIGGRNALATDVVAMAMAGFRAADHDIFRVCGEHGLGPLDLDAIEIVGEPLERASFRLELLRENVLEMPLSFCLNLLTAGELWQMHRALVLHGFLPEGSQAPEDRDDLLALLGGVLGADDYYGRALAACSDYALRLLDLIVVQGGTSGGMTAIDTEYSRRWGESTQYYSPAARQLVRLGLAYAVDSAYRNYYLLPEGLPAALDSHRAATGSR